MRKTGALPVRNSVDDLVALAGAAVEIAVVDAGLLDPLAGQGEEPGELAEHQHPVTVGHDVLQHLHQGVELGRGHPGVGGVDEGHVEAGLAQQGQGPEDLEAVLLHVARAGRGPSAAPAGGRSGRASVVAGVEVELEDLLLLVGQVAGHLLLGPAQHEGPDPAAQLGQALGVGVPLDGRR